MLEATVDAAVLDPEGFDFGCFTLAPELEAAEPPEVRGAGRDDVRLLVTTGAGSATHARFADLPTFLQPDDVLVINTSGTLNAAVDAHRADGARLELHLSTRLPAGLWIVEARRPDGVASRPFRALRAGERLTLPAGASVRIHTPYNGRDEAEPEDAESRLWIASIHTPIPVLEYLDAYGYPIRYGYVPRPWPKSAYQTVFAREPGSAEMPSAGRPFTDPIVERLVRRGVRIVPVLLHTGVASLEDHEPPYEEFYRVSADAARTINEARARGHRVVAVGTTVVRALETVADERGTVHPGEGWTRLVIGPSRPVRVVNGLVTGLHEPRSTHLHMLEAIAGRPHLARAYREALANGYLWHEFGDIHLLLA